MRHRVKKSFFNRGTKHRQAMLRGGLRNLLLHGYIVTTKAKAKEYKRLTDKVFAKALDGSVASRRKLHEFFGRRDIVNTLVERLAPAFKNRKSGFTRLVKFGTRRGDNTELYRLELVEKPAEMGSFAKKTEDKEKKEVKKTTTKK